MIEVVTMIVGLKVPFKLNKEVGYLPGGRFNANYDGYNPYIIHVKEL
jgi:hypothetical protein